MNEYLLKKDTFEVTNEIWNNGEHNISDLYLNTDDNQPEVLAKFYDKNLALDELEEFETIITDMGNYKLIELYFISQDFEDGEDYIEFSNYYDAEEIQDYYNEFRLEILKNNIEEANVSNYHKLDMKSEESAVDFKEYFNNEIDTSLHMISSKLDIDFVKENIDKFEDEFCSIEKTLFFHFENEYGNSCSDMIYGYDEGGFFEELEDFGGIENLENFSIFSLEI